MPRWSRPLQNSKLVGIASTAGLVSSSARVSVLPPLFCRRGGAEIGGGVRFVPCGCEGAVGVGVVLEVVAEGENRRTLGFAVRLGRAAARGRLGVVGHDRARHIDRPVGGTEPCARFGRFAKFDAGRLFLRVVAGDRRVGYQDRVFVESFSFGRAEDPRTNARDIVGNRRVFDIRCGILAGRTGHVAVDARAVVLDSAPFAAAGAGVVARHERAFEPQCASVVGDPASRECGAFGDPVFAEKQLLCVQDVAAEGAVGFVGVVRGPARDLEPGDAHFWFAGVKGGLDVEHPAWGSFHRHVHGCGACPGAEDHERVPDRELAVAAAQFVRAARDDDEVGFARCFWKRILVFDQLPQRAFFGGGVRARTGEVCLRPHRVGRRLSRGGQPGCAQCKEHCGHDRHRAEART